MVHAEKRLYLVFDFVDLDLKRHFDSCPAAAKDKQVIKASAYSRCVLWYFDGTVLNERVGAQSPLPRQSERRAGPFSRPSTEVPSPNPQGRGVLPLT